MSTYTQPCEYQVCQCVVTGELQGGAYCSDMCRERDEGDEEMVRGCACSHPPCDAPD